MADPKIRLKRSAVSGKRPTLANLDAGELALNTYDGNLFARQDTGGVGIATTVTLLTPWQEEYGAGAISYGGNVNVTGNLAVDATTLFVDSANNRIGMGTDNPAYQVEIENTGANALLVLDRTDGASCFIEGQLTRSAFGSVNATPLALAYNSLAVVTIGAGGSINVNPDGDGYTFPTTDGSANQVLQTDGEGNLSFADQFSGVGISSEGTYIGSGVTAFNFVGASVTSITVPSAGFSTISIDFNGINGIFAKTENKFSATEGQTSFSVDYEVGYIDVFLNGVRLNSDNFTATDGGTVGLTSAASAGDAVDIIVYEPQASATPKRVVTNATATAGQTAFTVPSYDTGSNSMDVFLNGIKLDSAEFTETDGTTVTLAVGAALNDELQFISYESDNNFWSLNGGTLHRSSISNPVAIGTDVSAGDYLTVGQVGASGTSLFVHGGARITGILTIGTGSITLDGSKNQISGLSGGLAVGTGASIFSPSSNILTLGTNNSEALRINSSGRIGVGIDPQRRFHVHESTSDVDLIVQFSNETTGSSVSDGFQLQVMASDGSVEFNNRENSYTSFKTSTTERMRISSTGNVGINTVSPTSPNERTRFIDISGGEGFNSASLVLTAGPSYSNPKWEFLTSSEGSSTRLQISNGSNSRLSIDSSGKVGVATASPQAQFHTVTDGSTLSGLFFGNGLRSQHPSGSIVTIGTQDGTDGKIEVSGNYPLRFHANSGERARILPSGGITFNGDTSTANALDDYEEGTWTPNIRENGSGTAWDTITAQSGYYVKIGQVVSFHFRISYSAVATNVVTGYYGWISGLPYSANATPTVGFFNMAFVNTGGSSTPYHGAFNGSVIMVYSNQDNSSPGPMRTSEYPAGAHEILAVGFYYV